MLDTNAVVDLRAATQPDTTVAAPRGPVWVEVDLAAVRRNVHRLRAWVGRGCGVMAVVKAEGYGLGAVPLARAALDAGAGALAVARVDEGLALREADIVAPILIISGTTPDQVEGAVRAGLTITATERAVLEPIRAAARRLGMRSTVHLELDTGLTRYGGSIAEIEACAAALANDPDIRLEGLYTHFASADEADNPFTEEQFARFSAFRRRLEHAGHVIPVYHACNSAGTLRGPAAHLDLVRCGLALHGVGEAAPHPEAPSLEPVARFVARVIRVLHVPAGATVGYGQTFACPRPMRLALLGAGYADGVPRALSNRGSVLIRGRRAPLVGRVSMDQCVADISDIGGVQPGQTALVWGTANGASLPIEQVAALAGSNTHELLTRISARVPRIYPSSVASQAQ